MNQTPAAILVLAASVCGNAACTRGPDSFGAAVGLVGVALGMWGILSLISPWMREHPLSMGNALPQAADPKIGVRDKRMGPEHANDQAGQRLRRVN